METFSVHLRVPRGNFSMAVALAMACLLASCTAQQTTRVVRTTPPSRNSTTRAVIGTPTVNTPTRAPTTTTATTTKATTTNATTAQGNSTVPSNITAVPSNSTTVPTKATTPSNTTVPSNTTIVPSNKTTVHSNTTVPSNITTVPSNTTTVTSNMTTVPSNTTTIPSNTTTVPSNTTTIPSNTTTIPSNTTTVPSNTTTVPSNMTTVPSNTTTVPSNTTTQLSNTTTLTPTPAPVARWQVRDKSGKLCMLMDFNGTITYSPEQGNEITSWIKEEATTEHSKCNKAWAKFMLDFNAQGMIWQMGLNFTDRGSSYILNEVSATLYTSSGTYIDIGYRQQEFFSVKDGYYYSCASLNQSMTPFTVNISRPIFQPFVQKTSTGSDLGKEFVCGSGGSSASHTGKIVLGVIVSILIVAAAVGITWYIIKKRRPQDPPYNRVN